MVVSMTFSMMISFDDEGRGSGGLRQLRVPADERRAFEVLDAGEAGDANIATARLALRAAGAGVEVDPDVRLDGREIFAGLRVDIVGETNAAPAGRDHEIVAELDAARAGALADVVAAARAAAIGDGAPCGGRAHRAPTLEAGDGHQRMGFAVAEPKTE